MSGKFEEEILTLSESSAVELGHLTESRKAYLIVEDDREIRESVARALAELSSRSSKSVHVFTSGSLTEAVAKREELKKKGFAVEFVLLDLWLPDADGFEAIDIFKQQYGDRVIIISAQGDADTIVKCLRKGADDFVEKPVNLSKIEDLLSQERYEVEPDRRFGSAITIRPKPKSNTKIVKGPGKTVRQPVIFMGLGIHSGRKFGVRIEPAKTGGVQFSPLGSDLVFPVAAVLAQPGSLCSIIQFEDFSVQTVEHLLSALWGVGVTDCVLKVSREIPILDGSAIEFVNAINRVGFEQTSEASTIVVDEELKLDFGGGKQIIVSPSDSFEVTYYLEVEGTIMEARYHEHQSYQTEVAPARTFSFLKDVAVAHSRDLAQGGRFNNFVLLEGAKPINTSFRFDNEPARHKVLDLIGDLYTSGYRWTCKIEAYRTGHRENIMLAKALSERYLEIS